jgi:hypothetical protein
MNTPPRTLAEAIDCLSQSLTPDELSAFAAQSEEELIDRHWGLGMRIRNDFGLWDPGSPLLQDCAAHKAPGAGWLHPDDASLMILHALWARLRH